jgi:hypothetical protein
MKRGLILIHTAIILVTLNACLSAQSNNADLKWHPGHYILLNNFNDRQEIINTTSELEGFSVVKGYQIRYRWKDLEPSKDAYDFSSVISDLNYLDSIGKFLVIQLQFKSFNNNTIYTPGYLEDEIYEGGIYNMSTGGWNLRLWNEYVAERLKKLVAALGDSLNQHPALALVNLAESAAPTAIEPELSNWKPYRDSFMTNLANMGYRLREAFPYTPTISYFNSGPTEALLFEEVALNSGHGAGGPDVYIGVYEKELHLRHAYDYTQRVAGKVPVGYGVQWHNYTWVGASSAHADPRGAVPPVEHFVFARDILKANFLFWVRRDPYWNDVKVLLSNVSHTGDPAGGLISDCPTLLDSICFESDTSQVPGTSELLVFDLNRPVTEEDHGFPKSESMVNPSKSIDAMFPGSNENWEVPTDFANGTLYMRLLIKAQPVEQNMNLQFCMWQDDMIGNKLGLETCTPVANVNGAPGTIATWSVPINNMWKKDNVPLDFTRPRERYGIAIKNSAGDPVSDYLDWNWNGEDPKKWYPLNIRFTVVAVKEGETFSGWDNYIWEQFTPPPPSTTALPDTVAYWSFDLLSNDLIPDLSGYENDLQTSGNVLFEEGKMEDALTLNASEQSFAYLSDNFLAKEFPASGKTASIDSFTVAAWFKVNSIDERSTIISKEEKDKRGFEFAIKNGYLGAQIYKNNEAGSKVESNRTIIQKDRWYHAAMTYAYVEDGFSHIRLYLDGEDEFEASNVVGPQISNTADVRIGSYYWSNSYSRYFNGKIDELFVFNKVVDKSDIAALMQITNIEKSRSIPLQPNHLKCYPNPFNDKATLEFNLQKPGDISLKVYTLSGILVDVLIDEYRASGNHQVAYSPTTLHSGAYIARLKTDHTENSTILKYTK